MYQHLSKKPVLVLSVIAALDVDAFRAMTVSGSYAAAGEHMLGVSDTKAYTGDELAVDILGTTTCEAGAAIAADALIQVGTDGKFITLAAGKAVGRALSAATGDGSKFEALIFPSNA